MGVAFALGVVAILLVCLVVLVVVFIVGLVLLIVGIVAGRKNRKKGLRKTYPKVLTVLGIILTVLPTALVVCFFMPSGDPAPEEIYDNETARVMEAFVERDAEGLRETFLEEKQSGISDGEIREAFSCIEGDIVSYEKLESDRTGGGSNEEYIYDEYTGGYSPVTTSTGKQYSIYVYSVVIWGEEGSGVESIVVQEISEGDAEKSVVLE